MKKLLPALLILLSLAACRKDSYREASVLFSQGRELELRNYPDSAVHFYRKAAELLKGSEHYELMSNIYNQYGDLLLHNEVYGKAAEAHRQALGYAIRLSDQSQASRAYRGIGKNYFLQKNVREAFHYFNKAVALSDRIGEQEELASVYNNLSNAYQAQEEYNKALEYSTKAISLTRDSLKIYRNYSVKGRIYTFLHQYDSALYYLSQANRSNDIRIQVSCLFKLSEMPTGSGITDSMKYNYLNRAQILQDSIERMDNAVKISEAEYQHQLGVLKNEDRHRLVITVSLAALLALGIFLFFYRRYRRRIRKYQEKIERLSDEFGRKEGLVMENNDREKQIIRIISHTGNAYCQHFTSTAYYKELRNKLEQGNSSLTYAELDELQQVVLKGFDVYIQQITGIINLSTNDSVLCCLSLLRFTTKECAVCRGVSSETIRSQKTRIKKRIPRTFFNNGLFQVMFGEE